MKRDTILCLCDYSGVMAQPWVMAGYTAILIDPQHPAGITIDGGYVRAGHEIDHPISWQVIRAYLPRLAFVVGFPPCTELAVSGARWFASKAAVDPAFQFKAMQVVWQCHVISEMIGAPYLIENPVSRISSFWRKPDHWFHPWHYTGWEPEDNYTKKTMLWCGGGFVMPPALEADGLGPPDNRIHHCPPGAERANIRSATPRGFARAVFAANGDIARNRQPSHPLGPKVERWVQEIEQGEEA
ncbi:hypothetical protein ACUN8C_05705 [Kushneria sp. Sum13]|uniref:hypothetical protein n=1 Tax=Kushneria sp. Sum13 TaxID=3459196 RepID=UPI0040454646